MEIASPTSGAERLLFRFASGARLHGTFYDEVSEPLCPFTVVESQVP